jgi:predicted DNA-binding transcriptional regulator AlpA
VSRHPLEEDGDRKMKGSLTTSNAAKLIGKSSHWLYVNAERLQIPRYRIGGRWVYLEVELNEWFQHQKIMQEDPLSRVLTQTSQRKTYVEF